MSDNPTAAFEVPAIASLLERVPEFSDEDHAKVIFAQASGLVDQYKRERLEAQRREHDLQVQLTEAVLARQGDAKKIEFLELENAELRNNIQTLQSDVNALREHMSKFRHVLEVCTQVLNTFGIKAPPKPERKPRNTKKLKSEKVTS